MTILGVDPGSVRTGFGVILCEDDGHVTRGYGAIDPKGAHIERLREIYDGLTLVIKEYAPSMCAVEMPVYAKNPQAMLKLGRAQAAAMLAAIHQGLTVAQYTPKEVKQSVTGNGAASKEQVAYMVRSLLGVRESPMSLDESDALAVALCHWHRQVSGAERQVHTDWESFVRKNPHRAR